jgi:hypothetical protein
MFKSGVLALFAAAVFAPCVAQADEFDQGMNTLWEVLWHQSGTATRLVRWEQDIKVRIYGANVAAHRAHTLQALRDVSRETGVKIYDVSDKPDAAQLANLSIEIVPDSALSQNQPCETRIDFKTETTIDSATTQMRDSDAQRCTYHEMMHAMGMRGHPEGNTVLSYFTSHTQNLLPLDKVMLRTWYSPKARAGMTPFEVLPILGDQMVALSANKAASTQARDRFLRRTVEQMQAFAEGQGDVPMILKKCGKATPEGVRYGRMEMSYFLGVAYLQGATVAKDDTQATAWLQKAAALGSRNARMQMASAGGTLVSGSR